MSSHHYVTDAQKSALIIGNGAECSMQLLQAVLEWCPLVVVLDGAYERVEKLGIKMDVVIGDFDSLKSEHRLPDIQYIHLPEQERTDLEKGIEWLNQQGYDDIKVIWATGNRLDHTLNNMSALAKYPDISLVFYDDFSKAYRIPSGFKKHFNKGDILSLIPLGKVEGIETENLKHALASESLELGVRSGTSNQAAEDGLVSIRYSSGHLILIESSDAAD